MGLWISPADLTPFATIDDAKAAAMISDAEAMAVLVAPCLTSATFPASKVPALVAILRGALLRWNEAGAGALTATMNVAGPYTQQQSYDTRQIRRAMFWPSEIQSLQDLCRDVPRGAAFMVDMTGLDGCGDPLEGAVVNGGACPPAGHWSGEESSSA